MTPRGGYEVRQVGVQKNGLLLQFYSKNKGFQRVVLKNFLQICHKLMFGTKKAKKMPIFLLFLLNCPLLLLNSA